MNFKKLHKGETLNNEKKMIMILAFMFIFGANVICNAQTAGDISDWSGIWYSTTADATVNVKEKEGFIDIFGKDEASEYSCMGILEKDNRGSFIECTGSGKTVDGRFLYKSILRMTEKGKIVEETWEAKYANGKKYSGTALFKRTKRASN